ncbi:MAG: sulfatase-like hydrolase/transferase [Akkermansiaceae bacterium]
MPTPNFFRFLLPRCALFFAVLCPVMARGEVVVDFSHSYSGAAGGFQNAGAISLAFTVDGSGGITLDASCAETGPAAYIDDFDGAVGTVSNPAIFGGSFTVVLSRAVNPATLRIDNMGAGLAIQGQNPQWIDAAAEVIEVNIPGGAAIFELRKVSYARASTSAGTSLNVNAISYPLTGAAGTVDVSGQGVGASFSISSAGDADTQGFVLSGLEFDLVAAPAGPSGFDNGAGDLDFAAAANWNPDGVPVAPGDAIIEGFEVTLESAVTSGPSALELREGSLVIRGAGTLSLDAMELGRELEDAAALILEGAGTKLSYSGNLGNGAGTFAVGSAGTVETRVGAAGSGLCDLGGGELILDLGSQWILDGSDYAGPYAVGTRFVLADFASFSGSTMGVRTRNFTLPANRKLELVSGATSLYYEIVAQTAAAGPNIIIINVDDIVGGQHFGFEGRDCLTPSIDSLAAGGIQFSEAFAASTVCGPSRYALLSGRWPSRNTSANFLAKFPTGTLGRFGVSDTELEDDGQNLGAWLQEAGYRTGFVGKSHVWDDDVKNTSNWAAKGLIGYSQTTDPATDATVNGAMQHNHRVLSQRMRTVGFDFVSGFYSANLLELRNDHLNVHNQEWITKNALDFIEENHEQRFFLYMAPTINHGPVRNDLSKSLGADPRYTSAGFFPNLDYSFMPTRTEIRNEVTTAGKQLISARETWIDYSIAALRDKLQAHGIQNDTLIIFTSDHGEKKLNVSPTDWGKSSLNDIGMKVPLVMHWPNGIAAGGRTYSELVSQVDFVPTLLELAGASSLPTRPVDGLSLVPVLNGSSAALRDEVFCEIGYARGVRTKDSKYIALRYPQSVYNQIESGVLWPNFSTGLLTEPRPYYTNNGSLGFNTAASNPRYFDDDQVFDLVADPEEEVNIYETVPQKAYDLKKRLAGYLGSIAGRPFRDLNDASTEFSPAPATAPIAPGGVQSEFLDLQNVRLSWSDSASNELGYIVEQSTAGGDFEIVAELPVGSETKDVAIDPAEEDIVFRVSSYNVLGDSHGAASCDLLSPEKWRYRQFADIDPALSNPVSQWGFDADGDGQATLWEYAFATDPRLASSVASPVQSVRQVGVDSFLEYLVPRVSRREVVIEGSVSLDLEMWRSGVPDCLLIEEEAGHLLFRSASPVAGEVRQFMRAEIEEP